MTFGHKSDSHFFAVSQKRQSVSKSTSVDSNKTWKLSETLTLKIGQTPGRMPDVLTIIGALSCAAIAAVRRGSHTHVMLPPNSRETGSGLTCNSSFRFHARILPDITIIHECNKFTNITTTGFPTNLMAKSSQCLHLEGLGAMITLSVTTNWKSITWLRVANLIFYKHFYGTPAACVNKREPVLNCTEWGWPVARKKYIYILYTRPCKYLL